MKQVLVIGVFNVLHPGHVRLLRFASECGDYLIVAVQSDDAAVKAAHVDEQLRLEGVQSNTYVNEAFLTDEDAKTLVQRLRPNVLVKGREYENRENPEEEMLVKYGGELLFDSGEVFFSSLDLLEREFKRSAVHSDHLPYDYMKRHEIEIEQLSSYVENFSDLSIVVVGDLIMDEYIICDPLGMSQEDPTIVVTPIDNETFVGGAGIVAAHAAGLGADVSLISVAGKDSMSEQALEMLGQAKVESYLINDIHRPTTQKQRYRSRGKTLLRVSHLHQSDVSKDIQEQMIE